MQLNVVITPAVSTVELERVDDFTSLSVMVSGAPEFEALSRVLASWGELDGNHVWLDISHLEQSIAAQLGDSEWQPKFAAMVDYARAQGWVGRNNRVRAHCESR